MQERRRLKMRNRILIQMLLLCISTTVFCQKLVCYKICNNSNSDIISWINFDSTSKQESQNLIREHFYKYVYDFNLTSLFWHVDDYKFEGYTPNLIVLIPAKKQFVYYVNKDCYKKGCYIVTFNRKEVEANLGFRFEDKWMYKDNSIYIKDCNKCAPYILHKKKIDCFKIIIN